MNCSEVATSKFFNFLITLQPCGGAIPLCMVDEFNLPADIIDRKVTKMKMISPSNREVDVGKTLSDKEYIGMCRREVLDGFLRQRAKDNGANVINGLVMRLEQVSYLYIFLILINTMLPLCRSLHIRYYEAEGFCSLDKSHLGCFNSIANFTAGCSESSRVLQHKARGPISTELWVSAASSVYWRRAKFVTLAGVTGSTSAFHYRQVMMSNVHKSDLDVLNLLYVFIGSYL